MHADFRGRTFRVFVSSTFSDLAAERDALQRVAFPRLREHCRRKGARFQAIDLRWGVSEEAGVDQQTMNICLEELRRCRQQSPRPNFIVLLGDRYGWRPLPPQLEAGEFEELHRAVSEADRALTERWYRRDDNAVPAEYVLQRREREFVERQRWAEEEARLLAVLVRAAEATIPSGDPRRQKYEYSATHQEILHGAIHAEDAQSHVFCYLRSLEQTPQIGDPEAGLFTDFLPDGTPDLEAQQRLARLKGELEARFGPAGHVYRWDVPRADAIAQSHLDALCARVESDLRRIIDEELDRLEKVESKANPEIEAHRRFGEERSKNFVGRDDILSRIVDYLGNAPDPTGQSIGLPLGQRGKEGVSGMDNNHPLVVHGVSGSGKTAIMAKAALDGESLHQSPLDPGGGEGRGEGTTVIYRFIGATPGSSDLRSLLESLCKQIAGAYGDQTPVPSSPRELIEDFPKRLAFATAERPLVLFLDALDQLSSADNARDLNWLPRELPPHVKLVVSVLETEGAPGECFPAAQRFVPVENMVPVGPLSPSHGEELLNVWLAAAHRTLQPEQRGEVLTKFAANGLPLYLKLAFEEARRWHSTISSPLATDIPGLLADLLHRLEEERNHGPVFTRRALGYLAAGRHGLTEDELLDVLSRDKQVLADFQRRSRNSPEVSHLPVIVWSRLYADLEPYLTSRAADGTVVLSFYHRQVREAVESAYLGGGEKPLAHGHLADYFKSQDHWLGSADKKDAGEKGQLPPTRATNLRKVAELPYQQTLGERWPELETTLTDLHFIEAKVAAGLTFDLVADCRLALDSLPEAQEEKKKQEAHEARVQKYIRDLIAYAKGEIKTLDIISSVEPWSNERIEEECRRIRENPTRQDRLQAFSNFAASETYPLLNFGARPGFVIQQAFNHAPCGPVHETAARTLTDTEAPILVRRWVASDKYNPKPALLRTLEGHTGVVEYACTTPDGRQAISTGGWKDGTIRVWDLETGRCLRSIEARIGADSKSLLTDPEPLLPIEAVLCIDGTPDGRRAITAFESELLPSDYCPKVWDIETGTCLQVLSGHKNQVNSVALTPDCRLAVSGGYDRSLRVWDHATGLCVQILEGHKAPLMSVCLTPDGRRAASADSGGTLRVWNLETGSCLHVLEGAAGSVSVTPDGRRAVSSSGNNVQVWDLETGSCRQLETHTENVLSVSMTPDGRRAVSASRDHTLRVWDLDTGICKRVLGENSSGFNCVCVTPDGRLVVSASNDKTLQVWDLEAASSIHLDAREGHADWVSSISVTTDGRRAVSAAAADDGKLRFWDLEKGSCLQVFEGLNVGGPVSVAPDGRRAVSGSYDGKLLVWDPQTGTCLRVLKGHTSLASCVRVTPDGRCVVSGSYDRTLRVWDLETGVCLRVLEHTSTIWGVNVMPDGRRVLFASGDNTLQIWDLETGSSLCVLEGHTNKISEISVTPDARRAVSTSEDQTLRVWDLETGVCLRVLEHTGTIRGVNVTPDGRRVLLASGDHTLKIWDLETGSYLAVARLSVAVTAVALSPVPNRIIVGTSTGEVYQFASQGLS